MGDLKAIKSFALGFGLVSIPVKLYGVASDSHAGMLNGLHICDDSDPDNVVMTRVQAPKWCPNCERHLEKEDVIKGYPLTSKGPYVPITPEELDTLPLASLREIKVDAFIPLEDPNLDFRWYSKMNSYVLAPDEVGQGAFLLFVQAMVKLEVMGIAKVAVKEREFLCTIRPWMGLLYIQTLHWAKEIKDVSSVMLDGAVKEEELTMAVQLIQAMTKPVDLASYEDSWLEALKMLIAAKLEGKEIPVTAAPAKPSADLSNALLVSLQAVAPEATRCLADNMDDPRQITKAVEA